MNLGPGGTDDVTISVWYTPLGGTLTSTPISVTLSGATLTGSYYNSSVRLNTGDRIHVKEVYTGGNQDTAHDLTVQLDLF